MSRWATVAALICLAACSNSPSQTSGTDSNAPEPAAQSDTSLLFSSTNERREAFRQIDLIAPTRPIAAGDEPFALAAAPEDLSAVTYTVAGESYPLSEFLAHPSRMGLIVVRDNNVLHESYSGGNTRETRWVSFSVAKSVTSMLIGAALRDGYIDSTNDPVVRYLPKLAGTAYQDATVQHLLQMASGIRWNEDYADPNSDVSQAGALNGERLVSYLAELPSTATPGTKFNYNSGETNLAGELLRAAIGGDAASYLSRKVWVPFGMEADASWMLGAQDGGELGGCCINATLRDYARIGLFAMSEGVLPDGTRVLPDGWMTASVAPSPSEPGYGYLWWLYEDYYAARGIFGQHILVDPANQLVIAVHSNAEAAVGTRYHEHLNAAVAAIRTQVITR